MFFYIRSLSDWSFISLEKKTQKLNHTYYRHQKHLSLYKIETVNEMRQDTMQVHRCVCNQVSNLYKTVPDHRGWCDQLHKTCTTKTLNWQSLWAKRNLWEIFAYAWTINDALWMSSTLQTPAYKYNTFIQSFYSLAQFTLKYARIWSLNL